MFLPAEKMNIIKIEAIFKAVAKSLAMALKQDKQFRDLPSTKGVL